MAFLRGIREPDNLFFGKSSIQTTFFTVSDFPDLWIFIFFP